MGLIPKQSITKVKDMYKTINRDMLLVEFNPIYLALGFEFYNWKNDRINGVRHD